MEFTLTTPDSLSHLSDFRSRYDGSVMVWCGTIIYVGDAESVMDAGAEFIITPVMLPDIIRWCTACNKVITPSSWGWPADPRG